MDDIRVGLAVRNIRVRRDLRQQDVADRASVSQQLVSLIERGHLDDVSLGVLRKVARVLDIRIDVSARWRGGDLDRLLSGHHSALHELVARWFARLPGWRIAPEVSFAIYADRGVIDILAWHAASRSLLVIELKTEIVDVQETLGTLHRKRRVAASVARDQSWDPRTVSTWLIVAGSRTNRRRIAAHTAMLRAAFPAGRSAIHRWLRDPSGSIDAMSTWPDTSPGGTRPTITSRKRVSRARSALPERGALEPQRRTEAKARRSGPLTGPSTPRTGTWPRRGRSSGWYMATARPLPAAAPAPHLAAPLAAWPAGQLIPCTP